MRYRVQGETAGGTNATDTPRPARKGKGPPGQHPTPPEEKATGARVERYKRHWAAYDADGELVCVTVYKKGAEEVVGRLAPPANPAT